MTYLVTVYPKVLSFLIIFLVFYTQFIVVTNGSFCVLLKILLHRLGPPAPYQIKGSW